MGPCTRGKFSCLCVFMGLSFTCFFLILDNCFFFVLTHCVKVRVRRVKGKGHYRDVMVD